MGMLQATVIAIAVTTPSAYGTTPQIAPFGAQGAFRQLAGNATQVSQFNGKIKSERGSIPTLQFVDEIRKAAANR